MSDIYEKRQHAQALNEAYRRAASAKVDTRVPSTAHVHPMSDGAFVEVQVWVEKAEAEAFLNART